MLVTANKFAVLRPVNRSYYLQLVCETNYTKLLRLLPDLADLEQVALRNDAGEPTLYARLLERTPYTVTLELTHYFAAGLEIRPEPAVHVRVFLDAKLAEVLCTDTKPFVRDVLRRNPSHKAVLDYKWHLNYFLEKWLDHCLRHNYRPVAATCGV